MPSFRSSKSGVKCKGDMVDTFDYANIDDFFNQPSAHELAAASERRVEEIMTDLNRRTIEELENWSNASYIEEMSRGSQSPNPTYRSTPRKEKPAETDMVSPPVSSALHSSSLAAASDTNCPAALSTKSKIVKKLKDHIPIVYQPDIPSPQSKLLPASSRQSEPRREVTRRASNAEGECPASLSTSPLSTLTPRATYLSPASIDTKDFAYEHQGTRSEDQRTPSLPCSKPLPAIPVAAEKQATRASSNPRPSNPKIPTIIITPPPIRKYGLRTPIVTRVTRKALPVDSPLLVPIM